MEKTSLPACGMDVNRLILMAEDHDKTERLIALRNSLQDSLDQCEAFAAHGILRVQLIEFIEYVDELIKKARK